MNCPTMTSRSVLAVAVASGRAGYVFLQDDALQDWGITVTKSNTTTQMAGFAQELITEHKPDVVVTQKLDEACRKGRTAQSLIRAVAEVASHNPVLDLAVVRPRNYPTKFEEAIALAGQHPEISGYLPKRKRRIYEFEPRGMVLFEALALAEPIIGGSTEEIAAAMG